MILKKINNSGGEVFEGSNNMRFILGRGIVYLNF